MKLIFVGIALAICFSSCNKKSFDDEEEMLIYLKNPDNGYYQYKNINGITLSIMYRPTDLLVSQEIEESINSTLIDSLKIKWRKYLYFNLSFSIKGKDITTVIPRNKNEYSELIGRLGFDMDRNVFLLTSRKDTISVLSYQYPRMFGLSNATTMIFAFPRTDKIKSSKTVDFIIKDFGLNTGEIKFQFSTFKLNEEPRIKF